MMRYVYVCNRDSKRENEVGRRGKVKVVEW
jgi:hypothetical protein